MEIGRVVVWWVLFQALLLLGWPLAATLLPKTPDRGAFVAIPVSLVAMGLPVFWIGHATLSIWTYVAGAAILLVLAGAAIVYTDFQPDRRAYLEIASVFSVAFLFMVLVQAAAAGIYPGGGEKFLDYGLLKSTLRSDYLPPADMWFAGERVVYYYGGHLLTATLARLSMTDGRFAYGLALSGFYAMEVTVVYGLASSIAVDRGLNRIRAGALGAFVFGFASNLLTPARVASHVLPSSVLGRVTGTLDASESGMYVLEPSEIPITPETFSYWTASRVIPGTINEFPLFSYKNGDLHAHMLSMAFTLLVIGILYGYYRTPPDRRKRRVGLLFGALPAVVGLQILVNTWSVPTALGLTALAVAGAPESPRTLLPGRVATALDPGTTGYRIREEIQRVVLGVIVAALIAIIAVFWAFPFVTGVLLVGSSGRQLAFFPERSPLAPFVLVWGAFLVVFAIYLGREVTDSMRAVSVALLVSVGLFVAAGPFDLVGLLLVGPLIVGGWYLLRRGTLTYEGVLLVAGAGLVVLVEFVFLADNAGPTRFNTVFKTYTQVWTIWAPVMGVALATLIRPQETVLPLSAQTRSKVGRIFVAVLVLSLSFYGVFTLASHVDDSSQWTLDGMAYAHERHPAEAAAIEWLDTTTGQPHLVSAPGWEVYTWRNPESSLTGLPTVAGWAHERIYRGGDAYGNRVRDVTILYNTSEAQSRATLLQKYDVEYIYVGPIEREQYDVQTYEDEPGISVAFENEAVTIYEVERSALDSTR